MDAHGGSYCKGNASCPSANCKGNCCPHASWCHLQGECKCPNADCKCSFSGGLDDESCTVSRSLPSSPIISTLFTLSRLKSARLVQSGLSASTPNPWHCNGPFSTLQFVTQMYFCIFVFCIFCIRQACPKCLGSYEVFSYYPESY